MDLDAYLWLFVQVLQLDQVQDQATELSVSIMKVRSIQPNWQIWSHYGSFEQHTKSMENSIDINCFIMERLALFESRV